MNALSRSLEIVVVMPHQPAGRYLWDFLDNDPHRPRLFHFSADDLARRNRPLGELRSLAALAVRALRSPGPVDVIVSVGALPAVVVEAMRWFSRRRHTPSVVLECIIYSAAGWRGRIKRYLFGNLLSRAVIVACGCTAEVEEYAAIYGLSRERLAVVPLFASPDVFGWPAGSVVPGSVFSGGNAFRDYALLIEAVRTLPVRVTIYAEHAALQGLSPSGNVVLEGPVPRTSFLDAMAAAELVALPIRPTAVSAGQMVLLQAMAMGKPVVVTDSPAIADYVRPEETALVVPYGSADALRAAILRLHRDPALRARLGAQARAVALEQYSGAAYAARVTKILEQAAGSAR